MRVFTYETRILLASPLTEVFQFFTDPRNLEGLTPPWLRFKALTPRPIEMAVDTVIDYRLRLRGIPLRWQSRIAAFDPPSRFVDEQVRGPYLLWVHEHLFSEQGVHTLAEDRVRYAVPGGALFNRLFVARDLDRIFRFRHQVLSERFGRGPSNPGAPDDPRVC